MDYVAAYIEMDVVCAVVLLFLLVKAGGNIGFADLHRAFSSMVLLGVAFLVFDAVWVLLDSGYLVFAGKTVWVNYLVRSLYWLTALGLALMSFWYFEMNQKSQLVATRTRVVLVAAPAIAVFALSLANPWTGWLFSLDAAGAYHRGLLFALLMGAIVGYLLAGTLRAAANYREESNYAERDRLLSYALFPLPIIIGSLAQMFVWKLPLASVGIMLAVLVLSLDTLRHMVSLDSLTQLNNRGYFTRVLAGRLRDEKRAMRTYLLLVDLDLFKQINDSYGHMEGDRALQCVAEALRLSFGVDEHALLGRYGGDEFLVALEAYDRSVIDSACGRFVEELGRQARDMGLACTLEASIGVAKCTEGCTRFPQLLEAADKDLYQKKALHAAARGARVSRASA